MQDLYGSTLGCTAADVKFLGVTGVEVYDPGAYQDENGIWKDACRGKDDYVNLAFTADIDLGADRYDVGMYINIEGGSALTGTCTVALLSDTNFQLGVVPPEQIAIDGGYVSIGELEPEGSRDYCPDCEFIPYVWIVTLYIILHYSCPFVLSDTSTVNGGGTLRDFPFSSVSFNNNFCSATIFLTGSAANSFSFHLVYLSSFD